MSATEDRRYWRERASEVLPSATGREIVRAAHLLREQYDAPTVRYDCIGSTLPAYVTARLDPRAFDAVAGGGVADFAPAPTAWTATRHEQRPDGEVSRYGMARVQGTTIGTSPDTPLGASGGLLSQMLEDLPRNSVGVAALDLYRLTQVFYGHDEQLPRMIGTDVSQRHQMIHASEADPMSCRVAVGGLTTVCTLQTWPWRGEHDSHTGDTSVLGKVYLRASERRGPGMLPAAHDDPARIWVGHRLVKRGKHAARKPRGKLEARTVAAVTIPDATSLVAVAECMNRGERVVVTLNGQRVTLTRGKGTAGTFSLTTPQGKASGLRTPQGVAKRVAELVA